MTLTADQIAAVQAQTRAIVITKALTVEQLIAALGGTPGTITITPGMTVDQLLEQLRPKPQGDGKRP